MNSHLKVVDGELNDVDIADRVATLGQRTVQYVNIKPNPMTFEGKQNEGAN